MKKFFIILLLIIPIYANSNNLEEEKKIESKHIVQDLKHQKKQLDEISNITKKGISIISDEIRVYGLKQTLQINSSFFIPLFIFICFFLLYLRGRIKK